MSADALGDAFREPKDAESDGESIAVVGSVLEAVKKAAKNLFKVDSNMKGGGGTDLYRKRQRLLLKFLEQLADSTEKDRAQQLMKAMDAQFNCKTLYTWRPYVLALLRTFGEQIEGYLRAGQLTIEQVSHAEATATAMADGRKPEPMPNPKPEKKKPPTGQVEVAEEKENKPSASAAAEPSGGVPLQLRDAPGRRKRRRSSEVRQMEAEKRLLRSRESRHRPTSVDEVGDISESEKREQHVPKSRSGKRAQDSSNKESAEIAKLSRLYEEGTARTMRLEAEVASMKALAIAVPEARQSSAKSGPSKVQRAGRTGASGGDHRTPRLDRFFKPRSTEAVQKDTDGTEAVQKDDGLENESGEDDVQQGNSSSSASSSPVPAPNASAHDSKGYYAALQVPTRAAYSEIKAAYRRLILQHHPDKGGCADAFRIVQEAYDLLSDDGKRAKYDSGFCGSSGQTQAETADVGQPEAAVLQSMAAKSAFATMLQRGRDSWPHVLAGMDLEILKLLASLCEASDAVPTGKPGKRKRDSSVHDAEDTPTQVSGLGIFRNKCGGGGWHVQVGWSSWKVRNVKVVPDLEQARDLHIALVDVRRAARARYQRFQSELEEVGLDAGRVRDSDDCEPMTHDEYLKLLQEEPFVPLQFCSDFMKTADTPRVQTLWTPSIQTAKRFRVLTRRALACGGDIAKVKANNAVQSKIDRTEYAQTFGDAAEFVRQEAARRSIESSSIEDKKNATVLCLKETSAEEEFAAMRAAMENEHEARKQEIQAMMATALQSIEDQKQCMEAQKEAHKQEMEAQKENISAQKQDMEAQLQDLQKRLEEAEKAKLSAQQGEMENLQAQIVALQAQQKKAEEAERQVQRETVAPPLGNPFLENNQNYLRRVTSAREREDNRIQRYMQETYKAFNRSGGSSRVRALNVAKSLVA